MIGCRIKKNLFVCLLYIFSQENNLYANIVANLSKLVKPYGFSLLLSDYLLFNKQDLFHDSFQ